MEFLNDIFIPGCWALTRVISNLSFVWFLPLIFRSTKLMLFLNRLKFSCFADFCEIRIKMTMVYSLYSGDPDMI